jgi:hypothetical protein
MSARGHSHLSHSRWGELCVLAHCLTNKWAVYVARLYYCWCLVCGHLRIFTVWIYTLISIIPVMPQCFDEVCESVKFSWCCHRGLCSCGVWLAMSGYSVPHVLKQHNASIFRALEVLDVCTINALLSSGRWRNSTHILYRNIGIQHIFHTCTNILYLTITLWASGSNLVL